jgi:hypothetical protein
MKTLKFYGTSDDLFECDGGVSEELCDNASGKTMTFHVRTETEGLLVTAKYMRNACWSIGLAQTDEGAAFPAWPISIGLADPSGYPDPRSYSTLITIEAPDDVQVSKWRKG